MPPVPDEYALMGIFLKVRDVAELRAALLLDADLGKHEAAFVAAARVVFERMRKADPTTANVALFAVGWADQFNQAVKDLHVVLRSL